MKKGLILALLMVAMVSLVIPAGAKAPIVNSLPDVIVGDADSTPTDGDYVVLRFIGAFDLADTSWINWNNDDSYTTDLKKVFWTVAADPDTTIGVFTEAGYVDPVTAGQWTLLEAGTPPADPALNVIQQVTGDWKTAVSFVDLEASPMVEADLFVDDAAVTTQTSGAYAYSSTADYSKVVTVKMAAVMTSGTKVVGDFTGGSNKSWDTFTVTCTKTAADVATGVQNEFTHDLTGTGNEGWTYVAVPAAGVLVAPTQVDDATGIGYSTTAVATGMVAHSRWESAYDSVAGDEAVVYRMTATLASTAAASDNCPGFRLYFKNRAFTHVGGVYFRHSSNPLQFGDEEVAPFNGNNKDIKLYWAVPTEMTEHADGEVLEGVAFDGQWATPASRIEARGYQVEFDLIADGGDSGRITMPTVRVDSFARPGFGTLAKAPNGADLAWGTATVDTNLPAGRAFNNGTGPWASTAFSGITGWTQVAATVSTTAITMPLTGTGQRYSRVTEGGIASGTTVPQNVLVPTADHTYRLTFEAKTSNVKTTPWHRCVITQQYPWDATINQAGTKQMYWVEFWAYGQFTQVWYQGSWNFSSLIPMTAIPTSPTTAGTKYEMYINAHGTAAPGADYSTTTQVVVEFSALSTGAFTDTTSGFGDNGTLTINYVSWDDLGTDY